MFKFRKLLSLTLVALLLFTLVDVTIYATKETIDSEYATGRIIVQFDRNLTESEKENHKKELELSTIKKLSKDGLEVLKYNINQPIEKVINKLNSKKGVLFAEPDYIVQSETVNPTEYADLWGLDQFNDIDIDAPEAWTVSKGNAPVIVAVIDTGVQISHPDLLGSFVVGYDFYNNDDSVYDGLDDKHGTHVSGTILAKANSNGIVGVVGENINIKIMPLKFLSAEGGYTSDAIEAIYYAKANGAHIINASWGGGGYNESLKQAIEYFGGPFIAAAGNKNTNNDQIAHYPSSYDSPNIVSVAAVDSFGDLASFSNYGITSVDIGAPGVSILSTLPENAYGKYNGTSMATPHVSGVAALLLSEKPTLTTKELIDILYDSGMSLTSLVGKTATGKMLNAYSAILALNTIDLMVINSNPLNGSKNVKLSTSIILTTNEVITGIDKAKITLKNAKGINIDINNFSFEYSRNTLTIKPNSNLATNTSYTLTLEQGALHNTYDKDGSKEFILKFSTGRK